VGEPKKSRPSRRCPPSCNRLPGCPWYGVS
jgi:hypothetical protein